MPLRLFPIKYVATGLAATLLPIGVAQAATLTHTDSVTSTQTNFTESVAIPQFDSSLGDLTNIFIELNGEVTGSIQLENTSTSSGADVTANLDSEIQLQKPDASTLLSVLSNESVNANFTVFDGNNDFGGTSGLTQNISDQATNSISLTDPSDFGLFLGTGNVSLLVAGLSSLTATGGGNLDTDFTAFAAANITVTYEYDAKPIPVPEPGISLGMLVFGGAVIAKRKFAKRA
jgi:hypothetical protein